jgi:hypothetical protein
MPYINEPNRELLDPRIEELAAHITSTGDLNYVVTRLALKHLIELGLNDYGNFDSEMGMFLCALLEMYRRVGTIYEDLKIKQNGDVPEYAQVEQMVRRLGNQLPANHAADASQAHG